MGVGGQSSFHHSRCWPICVGEQISDYAALAVGATMLSSLLARTPEHIVINASGCPPPAPPSPGDHRSRESLPRAFRV